MSAPQTDPEKQTRRHWGPLLGMALVVIFAVLIILYWIGEEITGSDPPRPTEDSPPVSSSPQEVIPPAGQQSPAQSPAAPPASQGSGN